jgi:hypothetical protein
MLLLKVRVLAPAVPALEERTTVVSIPATEDDTTVVLAGRDAPVTV